MGSENIFPRALLAVDNQKVFSDPISLIAGYWQPAPTAATDEIFFNGFQGC
jgi:hypothetical protein